MACCTARSRNILKRGNMLGFYNQKYSIQLTTHGWRVAYSINESVKCSQSLTTRKKCVHEQESVLLHVILLLTLSNAWENLFHLPLSSSDMPLSTRKFVDGFDNVIVVFSTKWPALLCTGCISAGRYSPERYVNLLFESGLPCVWCQLWFCNGLEWSMTSSLAVSSIFSFTWH